MSTQGTASSARERGGCLTAYLVLIVIGAIASLAIAVSAGAIVQSAAAQGVTVPTLPGWYVPATFVTIILSLVGAYGTWTWKKWGVYALVGTLVFNAIIGFLAGGQAASGLVGLVIGGALLWYVIFRDKWPLFE